MLLVLFAAVYPARNRASPDGRLPLLSLLDDSKCLSSVTPMADLICSPNAAVAYDFFTQNMGLSDFQAAAIIGNLQWESHLNPLNDVPDPTKNDPSARGRGIASWGPPRWNRLLSLATTTGQDPWTIYVQLDFLRYELESFPDLGLAALMQSTTLEEATVVFQDRFEQPKQVLAHTDRRIAYAQSALFACPAVIVPKRKAAGAVVAGVSLFALVAAAAYGAYKARIWRTE